MLRRKDARVQKDKSKTENVKKEVPHFKFLYEFTINRMFAFFFIT